MLQRTYFSFSLLVTLLIALGPCLAASKYSEKTLTREEYLLFLNTKKSASCNHCYDLKMAETLSQIYRLGNPGNYSYCGQDDNQEHPMLFLSHLSAQAYCDSQNDPMKPLSEDLTRIFHTDCDEETAKADGVRRVMKSDDGFMFRTARGRLRAWAQHPSGSPVSAVDEYEISGLSTLPDLGAHKSEHSEPTDTNALFTSTSLYPCDSLLCANIITYQRTLSFDTLTPQEGEEFSDTSWEIGGIVLFALLAGTSTTCCYRHRMTYGDRLAATPEEQLPIPYKNQCFFSLFPSPRQLEFDSASVQQDVTEFLSPEQECSTLDNTPFHQSRILYPSKRSEDGFFLVPLKD